MAAHSTTVFERLVALLDRAHIACEVLRHAPVRTSEEAAAVRGTPLASGAKALICKADEQFVLFVMRADRRLDSREVRKQFGLRGLRFATREEIAALTGLEPGAIPPFGQLFNLPTYCDESLRTQPRINFNAGDHAISASVATADYLAVERPAMGNFTQAG